MLLCARAFEHADDRLENNFKVQPDRTMIDVIEFELLPLAAFVSTVASAVRRPPADHTGFDGEQLSRVRAVLFVHFLPHERTRTDHGNFARKDRPDIGQFIQRSLAQKFPELCNARILYSRLYCSSCSGVSMSSSLSAFFFMLRNLGI